MILWPATHCYPGLEVAKGPVGSSSFVQFALHLCDAFYFSTNGAFEGRGHEKFPFCSP